MADYIAWLERQLRKRETVTLRLGTHITPAELAQEGYDDAVIAIGPRFRSLQIPGLTPENSCHVLEAYERADTLPEHVAVIGGSETGTEIGIYLAKKDHLVNVMTRQGMLCPETPHSHYVIMIMDYFKSIPTFSYTTFVRQYLSYDGNMLHYLAKDGSEHTVQADYVVVCAGSTPMLQAAMEFAGCAGQVHYIGDCVTQGNVHDATLAAWRIANQI